MYKPKIIRPTASRGKSLAQALAKVRCGTIRPGTPSSKKVNEHEETDPLGFADSTVAAGVLAAAQKHPTSPNGTPLVDELMRVETQLWESWKNGKPEVFDEIMTDDAVFFGQYGVASKSDILTQQRESVGQCKIKSYALTNARTIRIDDNSAILLYEAEQHAACGGAPVKPLMHGSSVYVKRVSKWMNAFRSEVPPAN